MFLSFIPCTRPGTLYRGGSDGLSAAAAASSPQGAACWRALVCMSSSMYNTMLHVAIDSADDLGPGLQQLIPQWAEPTLSKADPRTISRLRRHRPRAAFVGTCNSTHSVLYTAGGKNLTGATDIFVSSAVLGDGAPLIPAERRGKTNYLFFVEAPAHYKGPPVAHGYRGLVANTREATIWRPMSPVSRVQAAARQLTFDPSRDNIGIWIDHCYPHTRRHIINELVTSGLPVRSFGLCRHTTGHLGSPQHTLFSDQGSQE